MACSFWFFATEAHRLNLTVFDAISLQATDHSFRTLLTQGQVVFTPTALVGDKLYPRTTDHFWAFGKEAPSSLATVAPLVRAGTDSPPASAFPSA